MRAIVQDQYGTSDQLALTEVPDPTPASGEVLVRGLQLADGRVLAEHEVVWLPPFEVGTIIALGDGVTEHAIGDAVYGTARGSFAELAVLPLTRLAPCPSSITVEEAAAVPVSGLTALQALRMAGVGRGDRVLVVGASGGVGTFAVQLAVDLGEPAPQNHFHGGARQGGAQGPPGRAGRARVPARPALRDRASARWCRAAALPLPGLERRAPGHGAREPGRQLRRRRRQLQLPAPCL